MSDPVIIFVMWLILTAWVASLTWFVQIVIYPLFAKVGVGEYRDYHRFYTSHIWFVVILPGFATFLLPVPLALFGPSVPAWMAIANIILGLVGLALTLALQIPRHNRLEAGKNDRMIAELIRFNWPRTLSTTLQCALGVPMLLAVLAGA
ncbi:hypothetical protein GGC65_002423 [Sphingopyxis sp. OAS728]|uniref:hypothetical protein n=1 Tax=Sphingopyxis sp. OAS728 TaxID=2663823 RepID=UPI001789E20E|nr:hypothetical protein [Sphingopyxis sp. OAS728]MBE1527967.1 hypothetical protein [Sphingopyxis sp. OAS728]